MIRSTSEKQDIHENPEPLTGVVGEVKGHVTDHVAEYFTDHVEGNIEDTIKKLLLVFIGDMSRQELMEKLELKHRPYFMGSYVQPALIAKYIEMTLPEKPKSTKQKYRLSTKGIALKRQLENKKNYDQLNQREGHQSHR